MLLQVSGDNFTYTHKVLIKGQTTGPAITRLFQWLLPVGCRVDRKLNQSTHLDTSIPEGPVDQLPPADDGLKIDMTIKVFKDPLFQSPLRTPVSLPVGTPIYIELSVDKQKLQGGDNKAKIIVTKCVTYPFNHSNAALHHSVIDERIAVDKGTQIFQSPKLNVVRFKMQTFKIGIMFREVYLSCGAYVCPSSDNTSTCVDARAKIQHNSYATRQLAEFSASDSTPKPKSLMSVVSENFGVVLPKFQPGQLTQEDVPEIGEEDYIRIGSQDKLFYHFKSINGNYIVGLYNGDGKLKSYL